VIGRGSALIIPLYLSTKKRRRSRNKRRPRSERTTQTGGTRCVYCALTSAAQRSHGDVIRKIELFLSLFFLFFPPPLFLPAPPSLPSFLFDEVVGVQKGSGAAGMAPEHNAPWEEQTSAHPRRGVCVCVSVSVCE